ncbi:gp53-like domain-containing protein [Pseudomonas veronii]
MDYPKSVPNVGLINGKFVDENVGTGQPGSLIPSAWGSAVTDEILAVITAAGLVPNEAILNQLNAAINAKISNAATAFATQVEAEAGAVTTKAMSPLRVFQAIAKVVTQATESAFGWLKIATQAQVNAGLDDSKAVTPLKLATLLQATVPYTNESRPGLIQVSTMAQAQAGTENSTSMTPVKVAAAITARVATQAQVGAGVDDSTIVTPYKLQFGFSISLTTNGYIVFPSWLGRLILQWGLAPSSSVAGAVKNFVIPFPNACLSITGSPFGNVSASFEAAEFYAINSSTFTSANSFAATNSYFAVGY